MALALAGIAAIAFVVTYPLWLWRPPEFLAHQELLAAAAQELRLSAEHNARLIVIYVGGALVVASGLLYTARNYRLSRRGQVTEQFTKALERLSADELYVRVGGVRALEHVMRDSSRHHGDVVEVLVAFVRDRVPHVAAGPLDKGRWMLWPCGTAESEPPTEPEPDVQAALTALGRRPMRARRERGVLDLRQLHLQGARLSRVQLQHADLRETNLTNADLSESNLKNADLWSASLKEVDLTGANLKHVRLGEANLQAAHLTSVNLKGAYLGGANLHEAALFGAKVTAEQLYGAVVSEYTSLPEGFIRESSGEIRKE